MSHSFATTPSCTSTLINSAKCREISFHPFHFRPVFDADAEENQDEERTKLSLECVQITNNVYERLIEIESDEVCV